MTFVVHIQNPSIHAPRPVGYGSYGSVEISPVELALTQELRSTLAETILLPQTTKY